MFLFLCLSSQHYDYFAARLIVLEMLYYFGKCASDAFLVYL